MNVADKLLSAIDRALSPIPPQNAAQDTGSPSASAPPARSNEIPTREQIAHDRVTFRRPTKQDPTLALAGIPFPSAATNAAIATAWGKAIVGKQERTALEGIDVRWMRLSDWLVRVGHANAREVYEAHCADLAQRIAADDKGVEDADAWTIDDIREDLASKRQIVRAEMRKLEAEAWEICKPVAERFAGICQMLASDVEDSERATAAKFAITYTPSLTVLSLRKAALAADQASASGRPKAFLSFIPNV